MVSKITIPQSIRRALNYNEQKLQAGQATCIYAHNFLKAAEQLNFHQKLDRFGSLIALNTRAKTNAVHISLNFAVEEKMSREKLAQIASIYMHEIGFGSQPYLVYEHHDAGHPHIHIVTTNIQADGKRISLHNIGKNQSAVARKKIESMFNLTHAQRLSQIDVKETFPLTATKLKYGKGPTKRGIANILDHVLTSYKYSSLPELNALLKQYNICADRGNENGIIYKKRGLVYRVLNENGNKVGVPIKASSLYNKPTLDFLERQFVRNDVLKQNYKRQLKTSIDWILIKKPNEVQIFKQLLEKERISLVIRQNENGIIYGLTYIDHKTKCVFNGSDIGKEYSAKTILEKLGQPQLNYSGPQKLLLKNELAPTSENNRQHHLLRLFDSVVPPLEQTHYVQPEVRKPRKKKRRHL